MYFRGGHSRVIDELIAVCFLINEVLYFCPSYAFAFFKVGEVCKAP